MVESESKNKTLVGVNNNSSGVEYEAKNTTSDSVNNNSSAVESKLKNITSVGENNNRTAVESEAKTTTSDAVNINSTAVKSETKNETSTVIVKNSSTEPALKNTTTAGAKNSTNDNGIEPATTPVDGKNSSVHINGTTFEELLYLVSLQKNSSFVCAGAIISEYHVITAAHCFNGTNDTSLYQVLKNGTIYSISNLTIYPGYKNGSANDLAVLKLQKKIELDGKTKSSIDIAESSYDSKNGSDARLEGWNMTQPMSVVVSHVNMTVCNHTSVNNGSSPIEKGLICASALVSGSQSVCYGDSSLLIIDGKLAGISTSHNCTNQTMPIVFIEVAYFRNWTDGIIKPHAETEIDQPFSPEDNEVYLFFKYLMIFITCLVVIYLCIHLAVKCKVQRSDIIVRFSDYKRL